MYLATPQGSTTPTPGLMTFELMRGTKSHALPVADYARALVHGFESRTIYGGDDVFAAFADLFQTPICRYNLFESSPEVFGVPGAKASEHSILWIRGKSNAEDHCDILIPKVVDEAFAKHARMMAQALSWEWGVGKDLIVQFISDFMGRGIFAGRNFSKKDVLGWYDGHRCNFNGSLVFERQAVQELMQQFPVINRHRLGHTMMITHTLMPRQRKESAMLIDGHPLTHALLEDVKCGKFALANSTTNRHDATAVLDWVAAPDIPKDSAAEDAHLECFVIARKDIMSVAPSYMRECMAYHHHHHCHALLFYLHVG